MKKGWDSLLFGGEKNCLRSVRERKAWEWNQSLHYMTDNAWCDGARKHGASLVEHMTSFRMCSGTNIHSRQFQGSLVLLSQQILISYFNKCGTSKIWLSKLIGALLDHIPSLWESAVDDPLNSPHVLTKLSEIHSEESACLGQTRSVM